MSMEAIKELRERTNVSLGLCKKAYDEAGNVDKAIILLQRWGELRSAKVANKDTPAGSLYTYTHHNNRVSCILEVNCQTEFGARADELQKFCETISLQIIAMAPLYLSIDDISKDVLDHQRDIYQAQVPKGVPEDRVPHIINGKMKKWFSEVCLVNQKAVASEDNKTIEQLRQDLVSTMKENIVIKRFVRWELGE